MNEDTTPPKDAKPSDGAMPSKSRPVVLYMVSTIALFSLAGGAVAVLAASPGETMAKVRLILLFISIYGLSLGFIRGSGKGSKIDEVVVGLTSHNVLEYLWANFLFAALVASLVATAFAPSRETTVPRALMALGKLMWLLLGIPMLAYMLFHLLVLAPLTYPFWVLASSLVASVEMASEVDIVRTKGGELLASGHTLLVADTVKTRAYFVGVPALLVSWISMSLAAFGL